MISVRFSERCSLWLIGLCRCVFGAKTKKQKLWRHSSLLCCCCCCWKVLMFRMWTSDTKEVQSHGDVQPRGSGFMELQLRLRGKGREKRRLVEKKTERVWWKEGLTSQPCHSQWAAAQLMLMIQTSVYFHLLRMLLRPPLNWWTPDFNKDVTCDWRQIWNCRPGVKLRWNLLVSFGFGDWGHCPEDRRENW